MKELGYKTAYTNLKNALTPVYPQGEAAAIARIVVEELTGTPSGGAFLSDEKSFNVSQLLELERITTALMRQEPLQYILGHADFLDFRLTVSPDVLIPRPETEELAHWIMTDYTDAPAPSTALDIGTGSGCLALALKSALPDTAVVAADIHSAALKIAETNAKRYGLAISFLQLDILQTQAGNLLPELGLVVSNPPYIMPEEEASMLPNVLRYEPHAALFVTDGDPLQFYKAIERFARARLVREGCIYLELNAAQAPGIEAYYRNQGWNTLLKRDFQGQPRMLKAFRQI